MTLTIVLLTLAAARITRAVTLDDIGAPIRRLIESLFRRFGFWLRDRRYPCVARSLDAERPDLCISELPHHLCQERSWDELVVRWDEHGQTLATCPWCLGFWISLVAVITYALLPSDAVAWMSAPWALSYTVGILDGLADRA